MKRFLSRSMAFLLAGAHFAAAANLNNGTGPILPKGESYFKPGRCENAMEAFSEGKIESYLMNMATTPGQRFQLLSDYGLFFTKEYHAALALALQDRGIAPATSGYESIGSFIDASGRAQSQLRGLAKASRKDLVRFMKGLNDLVKASDAELDAFILKIFGHLAEIPAAHAGMAKAQVMSLQMKRLAQALETSKDRADYFDLIRLGTRLVLLKTLRQSYDRLMELQRHLVIKADWFAAPLFFEAILTLVPLVFYPVIFVNAPEGRGMTYVDLLQNEGWILLSGSLLWLSYWGFGRYIYSKPLREFDLPENLQSEAQLSSEKVQSVVESFQDLFEDYTRQMDGNIVTLEQACSQSDLCALNPVQLAYVGHTDILDLEALADRLQVQQALFTSEKYKLIQSAAESVLKAPNQYRMQISLIEVVGAYVLGFNETKGTLTTSLAALAKKINEVRTQVQVLRGKPYEVDVRNINENLLAKNETLFAKLDSDLASLRKMELDQDQFLNDIRELEPHIAKLQAFLDKAKSREAPWKEMTEELLFNLDEIPQGAQ